MNDEDTTTRRRGAAPVPPWLAELAACAGVLALVLAVAAPGLRDRREEARALSCDSLYRMLEDTTRAQIESVLGGGTDRCGNGGENYDGQDLLACLVLLNATEENPRNRYQPAYTTTGDAATNASSCRVGLTLIGTNGIRFNQFVRPDSATSRTFRVVVD